MTAPRFSLTTSFVAFVGVALLFDSLASIRQLAEFDVSRGTLSLTSLFFLVICVLMERTPTQVLLFTAAFYCWGLAALWLVTLVQAEVWIRFSLVAIGVAIASLAWLKPEPELIRSQFPR